MKEYGHPLKLSLIIKEEDSKRELGVLCVTWIYILLIVRDIVGLLPLSSILEFEHRNLVSFVKQTDKVSLLVVWLDILDDLRRV